MSIRNKLTLQFGLLASLVLGIASLAIYLMTADYRKDEFTERLNNRGTTTAKLLLQVDEISEDLLQIIERENPIRLLHQEQVVIYDENDSIIYHTGSYDGPLPSRSFIGLARKEGRAWAELDKREMVGFVFRDNNDQFVVAVSALDIFGRRKSQNLLRVLAIVMASGMLTFFIAGRVYAERALNPVKQLVTEITDITANNLNKRASEGNGTDELSQLAIAFNDMLTRLESAFIVQRNFIANASHEMRTPLTAISGQLEVLQMKERSAEYYRAAITSVLNDIHNLNLLANRLLLLAHAGTDAAEAHFAPVRLDDIIWEARTDLNKTRPKHGIEVMFDTSVADLEVLMVKGSDILLKTMVINLMENGCKYSAEHQVKVVLATDGKQGIIHFEDRGIGIAEQELPYIFEPFYRSVAVRGREGHGIGLSLVKRIIDLHKGTMQVHSTLGKGSRFSVMLPLCKV